LAAAAVTPKAKATAEEGILVARHGIDEALEAIHDARRAKHAALEAMDMDCCASWNE
jgi:hypothetical protein